MCVCMGVDLDICVNRYMCRGQVLINRLKQIDQAMNRDVKNLKQKKTFCGLSFKEGV